MLDLKRWVGAGFNEKYDRVAEGGIGRQQANKFQIESSSV
jgi:hypothetical protein